MYEKLQRTYKKINGKTPSCVVYENLSAPYSRKLYITQQTSN